MYRGRQFDGGQVLQLHLESLTFTNGLVLSLVDIDHVLRCIISRENVSSSCCRDAQKRKRGDVLGGQNAPPRARKVTCA